MESNLQRVRTVFHSPAHKVIWRLSKPFQGVIRGYLAAGDPRNFTVFGMTLVTKSLIDRVVGHDEEELWKNVRLLR